MTRGYGEPPRRGHPVSLPQKAAPEAPIFSRGYGNVSSLPEPGLPGLACPIRTRMRSVSPTVTQRGPSHLPTQYHSWVEHPTDPNATPICPTALPGRPRGAGGRESGPCTSHRPGHWGGRVRASCPFTAPAHPMGRQADPDGLPVGGPPGAEADPPVARSNSSRNRARARANASRSSGREPSRVKRSAAASGKAPPDQ